MKKILLITFISLCLYQAGGAQNNLVPNPSFEDYTVCPTNYFMLPTDWYSCSATPDYFNACDTTVNYSVPNNGAGNQTAFNGVGYIGLYTVYSGYIQGEYKEYIGCMLKSPLIIGKKYYIKFYVSLADISNCASNNIGLLFSTVSYQDFQPYDTIWGIPTNNFAHIFTNNIITDTANWTSIYGNFIADSAYQYISIGNFFDKNHTDTLMYNSYPGYAFYYIDEVCISEDSLTCTSSNSIYENIKNDTYVNVYPNPTFNFINITLSYSPTKSVEYLICNIYGQIINKFTVTGKTFKINVSEYTKGTYILQIKTDNLIINQKIIIY